MHGMSIEFDYTHMQCRYKSFYPPVQAVPLTPSPFFSLSRTDDPTKVGTCVRDRRALQQLALNVHVKHYDLT